jgi:hypothetical protein
MMTAKLVDVSRANEMTNQRWKFFAAQSAEKFDWIFYSYVTAMSDCFDEYVILRKKSIHYIDATTFLGLTFVLLCRRYDFCACSLFRLETEKMLLLFPLWRFISVSQG